MKEFSSKTIQELDQGTPRQTYTLLYQLTQLQEKLPLLKKYSLIDLYNLEEFWLF